MSQRALCIISYNCVWIYNYFVQSLSHVPLFVIQWAAAFQASLSFAVSRVHSSSCPLTQWCRPTISSSVSPFSFCHQPFPASGSLTMSWLFASGGQSFGASASILPMNIQGWCPLGLTGLISLQSKGLSRVLSSTTIWKHQFFGIQPSLWPNSDISTWLLENHSFDYMDLCWQVMSLLFNTLSRFFIVFLSRSKYLDFIAAVTAHSDFGVQDSKICHCFCFSPIYLP